jgi:hypothetical protein
MYWRQTALSVGICHVVETECVVSGYMSCSGDSVLSVGIRHVLETQCVVCRFESYTGDTECCVQVCEF